MKRRSLVLALLLLASSGCGKFGFDGTVTIPEDEPFAQVEFRPPGEEKKATLAVSAGEPVAVYVVLGDDMDEAVTRLRGGKEPRRVLARGSAAKESALEVTLPAKRGFLVFLSRGEKGTREVGVKLSLK